MRGPWRSSGGAASGKRQALGNFSGIDLSRKRFRKLATPRFHSSGTNFGFRVLVRTLQIIRPKNLAGGIGCKILLLSPKKKPLYHCQPQTQYEDN